MTPDELAAEGRKGEDIHRAAREAERFLSHAWECWEGNVLDDMPTDTAHKLTPTGMLVHFAHWLLNNTADGLEEWHKELTQGK